MVKKIDFTKEAIDQIIKAYNNEWSIIDISKGIKLNGKNVNPKTIKRVLLENNIQIRNYVTNRTLEKIGRVSRDRVKEVKTNG